MFRGKYLAHSFSFVAMLLALTPCLLALDVRDNQPAKEEARAFVERSESGYLAVLDLEAEAPTLSHDIYISGKPVLPKLAFSILVFQRDGGLLCLWCGCSTENHNSGQCAGGTVPANCASHPYSACTW